MGVKKILTKTKYKDLSYRYELLRDLMEHTPDVIYFKDRQGRFIMVNRAHAKGLGLDPKDVVGKTDFDFIPPERAAKFRGRPPRHKDRQAHSR